MYRVLCLVTCYFMRFSSWTEYLRGSNISLPLDIIKANRSNFEACRYIVIYTLVVLLVCMMVSVYGVVYLYN